MIENPELAAAVRHFRIITCIMHAGRGFEVLEALEHETGVISATVHHARGIGRRTLRHRLYSDEKQVLTAMVEESSADAIFEYIYFAAGLNQPHSGMVMMSKPFRGVDVVPWPEPEDDVQ